MTAQASSPLYSLVTFLVPSLFCGALVARLFPSDTGARATLPRHSPTGWAWRLALACLAFVPIYLLFGMLVYPITQQYYTQNMYGLNTTAGYAQLIPVLLTRSVLFLLVCLPIILLWQKSERSLILSLGFALFVLVGFLGMLAAYWMPLTLRVPHTVEIMADSFAYAGVLVLLLLGWKRRPA